MVPGLEERTLGAATVLFGAGRGKYPDANTLLVRGSEETVLIDTALGTVERGDSHPPIDRLILSHCHEDHTAGNFLFPDVPCHLHEQDLPGIRSLPAMLEIFGLPEPNRSRLERRLVEVFHFRPRPDARAFSDGSEWDLGGGVRVRALHTPGHTRGHSAFLVEPDDLLFVADVDLSSFGPYYGDAWSSLTCFEESLARLRSIRARVYLTSHHKGMVEGAEAFRRAVDRYTAVIADRERRLLAFLAAPHTLDEVVAHRFVYRPQDSADTQPAERRSMSQHLDRLLEQERIREVEPGRYLRAR